MPTSDPTGDALDLLDEFYRQRERIDHLDSYYRGDHDQPYMPSTATKEYKLLAARSISNWLPLVVDVMAQTLYVEGYRPGTVTDDDHGPWERYWQPNGLDARQSAIHRGALKYGLSYALVVPGTPAPVIRGLSPRRMLAVYDDPAMDVWPALAIRIEPRSSMVYLYDDVAVYRFRRDKDDRRKLTLLDALEHGAGECPVVRFADCPDLEGRSVGEVEPLIPIQDRINQTAFDLLIAQTYGSFKVRTISGMATPVDEEGRPLGTIELSIKRFLVAEDADTKFGQLDETNLEGYLNSLDLSVRHMAAISQTPPHVLLGQMANLSAEALVAAESGLTRKTEERRHVFGDAWERTIRLAAKLAGDTATAGDLSAQVVWRDAEARSLSQTVDAWGKAVTMLGIPAQAAWERIPGVTLTDVQRWRDMAVDGDPSMLAIAAALERQSAPTSAMPPAA